jgi:FAD/FMN-containing dehydrogenase
LREYDGQRGLPGPAQGSQEPHYVGDQPAGTQTVGWLDAWASAPSVYAVAARSSADVIAAVNFARENKLRLVVKGGGHSYQGTSDAADSLLIWTRAMNAVVLHDAFVAQGCTQATQPAVTIEGAIWMHVYDAVTTKGGRYVQGGGCATVGVAGLIQSGGFGSFSKNFGTAAGGLLGAEVVTADGKLRVANACTNPDLFWGLKGGGGGSLGVVTKLTNPAVLTAFALAIIAGGDRGAYADLIRPPLDRATARKNAADIGKAADELRKVIPNPGSYVSESNFFERDWQRSFWGSNYPRMRAVKAKYDPAGLFFVHHGVGSEDWSADGFTQLM